MSQQIIIKKPGQQHRITAAVLAACLVPALMSGTLLAAEYSLESELRLTTEYNDNVRLQPENEISLYGGSVRPKVTAAVKESTWEAAATVDLWFNKYDDSDYDSNDYYISFDTNKRTENHILGLTGSFIGDTTLTSETDTSGTVADAKRRNSNTLSPSWIYLINQNNYMQTGLSYTTVDFEEKDRFTPYDYLSAYTLWNHTLSENMSLNTQLSYSYFEPNNRGPFPVGAPFPFGITYGNQTDSYTAQFGGDYQVTEKFKVGALLGSTYADSTYNIKEVQFSSPVGCAFYEANAGMLAVPSLCSLEDYSTTSFTGQINADWEGERTIITASYDISEQPSSQGYVVRAQLAELDWRYRLSEMSNIKLLLVAGRNKAIDSSVSDIDPDNSNRDFANLRAIYSHRLTERWWFNITGNLRWQDRERLTDDASGAGVLLGITYRPTIRSWSR